MHLVNFTLCQVYHYSRVVIQCISIEGFAQINQYKKSPVGGGGGDNIQGGVHEKPGILFSVKYIAHMATVSYWSINIC